MRRTPPQHYTKSFFLLCACWRLHKAGVCTSGFSWSAPPPTTMLPVNPSLFIIRCDTPTRGRCIIFYDISNPDAGSFPSLHLKAPGVWADARPCSGSAGRPADRARSASPRTYNHLLRLIHCKLQPVSEAGRMGCSEPISSQ